MYTVLINVEISNQIINKVVYKNTYDIINCRLNLKQ